VTLTLLDVLASAAFGTVFGAGAVLGTIRATLKRHDDMIGNGKPGVFVRTEAMDEWRHLVASWREADAARAQRLEESVLRLAKSIEEGRR